MKKSKILAVSLLCVSILTLSSCDVAIATMSNADDDAFVTTDGNTVAVDNNTLQVLYDLIYDDDNFNSEVEDLLMYQIAKNYLGNYTINENGDIELEGWDYIVDSDGNESTPTQDEQIEFIQNHQAYWNWEDAGIRITYEDYDSVTSDNYEDYQNRIDSYKALIKKQVVVTMFNNINVTDYKYNNAFYEILYVKDLMEDYYSIYEVDTEDGQIAEEELSYTYVYQQYETLKENDYEIDLDVEDPYESSDGQFTQGVYINSGYDPEKDYENIIDGDSPLIHLGHYVNYINSEVIPDIMNNLLTELYIMQNQYAAIGRTQQRKIEYVQITNNEENDGYNILRNYLREYFSAADEINETITEDNLSFESACLAWQGVPDDLGFQATEDATEDEYDSTYDGTVIVDGEIDTNRLGRKVAEDTFGEATSAWQNTNVLLTDSNQDTVKYIDGNANDYYYYYDDSLYGDLIADYSTLTDNPLTNDETNYDSFTSINDRLYSPEQGLEIQKNELRVEDYTTYGWGTKSDYSDLPDSITDRLFSASIVNELNSVSTYDTSTVDWTYLKTFQPGGVAFLKKESYSLWDDYDSVIWSNDDGTSFYLVVVYDYVTPSKTTSNDSTTKEEMETIEQYALEVGYEIASGSTYTSSALEYFLENSYITYFDQNVFDYFVDTYPDLFDY